jgi:DNA polymerase-3 subunit epsilon
VADQQRINEGVREVNWAAPEVRRGSWDTETTGTNVETDRIVTAAFIVRGRGLPDARFSWVINPGVEVPDEAVQVHGWTTERLAEVGVEPKGALEDIASKLAAALKFGMPLVAFNAGFDWSILHYELLRHGLPTMAERLDGEPLSLIDGYVIDKAVDKYRRGSRKLKPTCEVYGVELTDWHTAEADAEAALLIVEEIAVRYPHVAAMGPAELFAAQKAWAASQAASLQAYLRSEKAGEKRDPGAVVDGSWPLRGGS